MQPAFQAQTAPSSLVLPAVVSHAMGLDGGDVEKRLTMSLDEIIKTQKQDPKQGRTAAAQQVSDCCLRQPLCMTVVIPFIQA